MKKRFRKLTAIATTALMATCLMVPMTANYTACAEGSISITDSSTGRDYDAYQIFKGVASGNTLSNVDWGTGVNGAAALEDIKKISGFEGCSTAADVAAALAATDDDSETAQAFAKAVGEHLTSTKTDLTESGGTYAATGLADGYYLIKEGSIAAEGDAYTRYIVRVLGDDTAVNPKRELPTFEKKVGDINDSDTTPTTTYGDSADYDIGDDVPFQLTGTVPINYGDYDTYTYVMHDTLSAGLTFNNDVTVTLDGATLDSSKYTVNASPADSCTFEISFTDLSAAKKDSASTIVVSYTAELNDSAVIGGTGNPNTAKLKYSNNPNGTGTGTTPEDKVTVFTYQTIVNKKDSSGSDLTGAEFKLSKKVGADWVEVTTKTFADPKFTFTGLDDGLYKLEETETPDGYNTIAPIYFKVEATHETNSDDPTLTELKATQVNEDGSAYSGTSATFKPDLSVGSLSTDVINNKGSELPETGGIGTTIFFVGGGALVAIAGVFLIVKRRMSNR